MKRYLNFLIQPLLLASCLFGLIFGQEQNQIIRAGLAKVKITPQKPVRMAGYGARSEPFKDVHDDLFASALVFDDGQRQAMIITADVIGFSHDFCDNTRKLISQSVRKLPKLAVLSNDYPTHDGTGHSRLMHVHLVALSSVQTTPNPLLSRRPAGL